MHDAEKAKFNILHVITRLPVGGVENMLLKVITGYNPDRFNALICCMKEGGEIADELAKLGYQVLVLNRMKGHGFEIGLIKALFRIMKRENIHILRTHQYHANLYGRIAGILAGVPVIIPSFHNLYESPDRPKLHRRIINHVLSYLSDAIVPVSDAVASDIIRFDKVGRSKIQVIYNGVPIEKYTHRISRYDARKTMDLPTDKVLIGSVGRLTRQKNHSLLIEASAGIDNASVAIAGDGPLLNELESFSKSRGSHCIFMGRIQPEQIPIFLSAIDIFCFPSLWEGFGTALIEAMALGLPVVVSDIITCREVAGDAGIFFRPGDKNGLFKILQNLVCDKDLRDNSGMKSCERAKLFTIEKVIQKYEALFFDILKKKGLD